MTVVDGSAREYGRRDAVQERSVPVERFALERVLFWERGRLDIAGEVDRRSLPPGAEARAQYTKATEAAWEQLTRLCEVSATIDVA